jgi:hypothetical protein
MVVQKVVKNYPMVKWFVGLSVVLIVVGLVMSKVTTAHGDTTLLLMYVGAAVVLPFLALAFPRKQVLTLELPTDHLSSMSKTELVGVLQQLDAAKAKGEMDEDRYAKARSRVQAAIKARAKPKA